MNVRKTKESFLLAIDQGTTSTRTVAFDINGAAVASAQLPFRQIYPRDGWVEHDANEIWQTTLTSLTKVLSETGGVGSVAAIGITNQRETTVLWDRKNGKPVGNAIVWQDRRGAAACHALNDSGYGKIVQERTGLVPDSYFSATKLQWLLQSDRDICARAKRGELAFGTIDSFLLWHLTGGQVHATDATNASRTMLFNIHTQTWDQELLDHFDIPELVLPDVRDTADDYGETAADLLGRNIPITALVGDQQSALAGQMCFSPGMAKATFGTGAFVLLNTGATAATSNNRLLTTIGCRLQGETTYAVEGSVFNAGTVVQWLRDEAGFFTDSAESETLARGSKQGAVTFVPAFTGLGAPYWDPQARGAIFGMTRDTTKADIVRAGLEAVCFQTNDLLDAMISDTGKPLDILRVDGGMAANDWMLQTLANVIQIPVERPTYLETTAQGAALFAGLGAHLFASPKDLLHLRSVDHIFEPKASIDWRETELTRWKKAIAGVQIVSTEPAKN